MSLCGEVMLTAEAQKKIKKVTPDEYNEYSGIVLDAALAVHREMGPGLLESVYQHCLAREWYLREVEIETNVAVPLVYKGCTINKEYIIDLLCRR